jgi:hypothetical protein
MHSDSFKQLPDFFDLIAFGLLAGMWAMTSPLFILDCDFDARAFTLKHFASQRDQKRLDVVKDNRWRSRLCKDVPQCFSMLRVHGKMLAKNESKCKHETLANVRQRLRRQRMSYSVWRFEHFSHVHLLVLVHNFNLVGTMVMPHETDPPLVIDADEGWVFRSNVTGHSGLS